MAICNNVTKIEHSEFLGSSLFKINTNYSNLDKGICQLGKDLLALDAFVKSLTVKDSSTIDMSFSVAGYFLSADVINNSLGANKLGQDIPQTTKTFLTAAKISSLIDTDILNLKNQNVFKWNGSKWVNVAVTDLYGALALYELNDVYIDNNTLFDRNVLKYNSSKDRWENSLETGLSAIPDGNYEDITVTGGGQIWNINPERVADRELKSLSVMTSAIGTQQITNNKFYGGITLNKCAFSVGEVNKGVNVGQGGVSICLETNQNKKIPLKTLKGVNCSVKSYIDHIEIEHAPWPNFSGWPTPDPPFIQTRPTNAYNGSLVPQGANLGSQGASVFLSPIVYTSDNPFLPVYQARFKSLTVKPFDRLIFEELNTSELTVTVKPDILGIAIVGNKADGTIMSDVEISEKITTLLPPENFETNTICNVVLQTVQPPSLSAQNVDVFLRISYLFLKDVVNVPGSIINYNRGTAGYTIINTYLDFINPNPVKVPNTIRWETTKNLTGTTSVPIAQLTVNNTIFQYKKVDTGWVRV